MPNISKASKNNAEKRSVSMRDLVITYRVYGNGTTHILCFHGHGRSSEDFQFLAHRSRKIISIDLFLHGDSTFDETRIHNDLITKSDVEKLLEKIFEKENVSSMHWVAYSQGGRFALTLFPLFHERIESFSLLAPDGLNDKNFYSWSQRRWWARKLFRRWIKKPNELMTITRALAKTKVIRPKIVDFLHYYTQYQDRLHLAYATWSGFRNLRPDEDLLSQLLKKKRIPFQLIVGKYDQIISPKSAQNFLKRIDQQDALRLLPHGHDLFKENVLDEIRHLLNFEALGRRKRRK